MILGIFGFSFEISLYGFETNEPISIVGVSMILLFVFKGVTAYSLLKEKDWAITLGIMDAITGIVLCCLVMAYPFIDSGSGANLNLRLELLLLVPYLIKLLKIKPEWEKSTMF